MLFKRSVQKMMLILLISIIGLRLQTACYVRASDDASQRIQEADRSMREAFNAVLKVEEAGANTSGLMAALNDAGSLLAKAEIAYRNGDSGEAAPYADNAFTKTESVLADASSLEGSSQAEAGNALSYSLVFSVIGALAFLAGLFLVWSLFKRVRTKKLYSMKPEVR